MRALLATLTGTLVPPWARWLAIAALALSAYELGRLHEARDAAGKVVTQVVTTVKKEVQTVTRVETVYRDRIQKIYVQEKQLEADVPTYIPPATDQLFAVPVGFVRVAAAAWSGTAAGPAAESDREPAGISFSELGSIEVANATSCRVWREQALGWREFYAKQQVTFNGKAGDWYQPDDDHPRDPGQPSQTER
jgi:hypothetical protein